MDPIEFGKKCRPYNGKYKEIFGYVPCRGDYRCNQDDYFAALVKSIETKQEISAFVPKKDIDFVNTNKKY